MDKLVGPTEESNWLIPEKLIVGSCPITLEEMKDIAEEGVDCLVCLLNHEDFSSRISKKKYKRLASSAKIKKVIFKPIADGDITSDKRAFGIAEMIISTLENGGIIYLHCWGGHGRAGTIGTMVLGQWYKVSFEEVIYFLQKSHQTRSEGGHYPTPQTEEQMYQASRFFEENNLPIIRQLIKI